MDIDLKNVQGKIITIFAYIKQMSKNNVVVVNETKTNIYFKVGKNCQVLDLYKPTIKKIDTFPGLLSEAKFQFEELV